MARSEDRAMRVKAAQNRATPLAARDLLLKDPDVEVRRSLAHAWCRELSAVFLEDVDEVVRCIGARGADASRLPALAEDPSPSVRSNVANNPAVTAQLLERLARDEDGRVRADVAGSRRTPRRLLQMLTRDPETRVRRIASGALQGTPRLCDCCGLEHGSDKIAGTSATEG